MRAVFGLVLVAGIGLAGFAVYMAQGYFEQQQIALQQERAAAARIVPTVEVYAMVKAIDYGEELTPEHVQLIPYVEAALPEGVFRTEDELFPQGTDELRVVTRRMEPNEPVLVSKVTAPGEEAGITSRLSPGMRAFAISVDVSSGVSGFLRPGDRVDVYWTGRAMGIDGPGSGEITKLIDTALRLVAVDQSANADRSGAMIARTVTVEATPQQVAALAQAQSTGRLSLALVGAEDDIVAQVVEVDQRTLLGIAEQPVFQAEPEPEVCTVRTRRGAEIMEIPIPCTN